jgi:hypothetical protein
MNIYYELSDCVVGLHGKGKYLAAYDIRKSEGFASTRYGAIMRGADRAWAEDETGVRFLKHRFADIPLVQVDIEEFLMIKLKCIAV